MSYSAENINCTVEACRNQEEWNSSYWLKCRKFGLYQLLLLQGYKELVGCCLFKPCGVAGKPDSTWRLFFIIYCQITWHSDCWFGCWVGTLQTTTLQQAPRGNTCLPSASRTNFPCFLSWLPLDHPIPLVRWQAVQELLHIMTSFCCSWFLTYFHLLLLVLHVFPHPGMVCLPLGVHLQSCSQHPLPRVSSVSPISIVPLN